MPTKRRYFLFLILTVTLTTLFLAEICIRLFSEAGYITPEILKKNSLQYVPAPFSKFALAPREQEVVNSLGAKIHINARGYRGKDFEVPKPEGRVRIVFYGGSSTFDIAASEGQDWPRRVEARLKEMGLSHVEVINAGVPGYSTFDAFGSLFAEGHLLDPDFVILYDTWNDIKYFGHKEPLLRQYRPYNDRDNPLLEYQNLFDRLLCELSQLYVRLRYRYFLWKYPFGLEGKKVASGTTSEIAQTALRQYQLNLEMFVDLARNIGAVPILMTEARLADSHSPETQKEKIHFEYHTLTPDSVFEAFRKSDEIIFQVAKKKNVPWIDASRQMTGHEDFFIDEVHLSQKGAGELAHLTADALAPLLKQKETLRT